MKKSNPSSALLEKFHLRRTTFREELASLFLKTKSSMSVDDIRAKVQSSKDKVTVYRALEVFEKNGIIHKVPDKENLLRFALCTECNVHEHRHDHVHFICQSCSQTYCLDSIESPKISAPKGFAVIESETTLKGLCKNCSHA